MLFSSFTFLFFFLPIVFLLYYACRNRIYRNSILLISSLLFYSWGEPIYVFLMITIILINFSLALVLDRFNHKKLLLSLIVLLNFGSLAFYKYTNFFIDNFNVLGGSIQPLNIVLPIGISFYTFQIMSYIIDVYRGKVKAQKNIINFACYVALFPQLIAGPIVRYIDIERELNERQESIDRVYIGLRRFIVGLGKKIIISNHVAIIANDIFNLTNSELTFTTAWLGAIAFSLQIYFDFSGYSDMAIGLGKMFGFDFLENFNYPYIASSITEFWNRWHISLSSWFKDYVYIPLGGNRKGVVRQIINLFVVWALTGLWHGAAWNFVLWGLYFFVILIVEKFILKKILDKMYGINHLYTLILIIVGWVIFNSRDFAQISSFIGNMFSFQNIDLSIFETMNYLYLLPYLMIGIIFSLPIVPVVQAKIKELIPLQVLIDLSTYIILMLCIVYLVNETYNPFIYFRF